METCLVVSPHEIPSRAPIQVEPGDVVEVGERDTEWPEFVFVTASSGAGWVPARHLSIPEPPDGPATVVVAYDTTELPTRAGERLTIVEQDRRSGWTWCRNDAGCEGWVPERSLRRERTSETSTPDAG